MADDKSATPNGPEAPLATTAEVQAVVQNVQRQHRSRIRWSVGQHTAELALRALDEEPKRQHRPSAKARRRKRHKRLL
jgi:hypothetical protein